MTHDVPADGSFIRRTFAGAHIGTMRILTSFVAATLLLPIAAQAETIRLTPEQAEAAIESGAARRTRSVDALSDLPGADRGIHGEVGVSVGTGGYRSIYGEAAIPLGNTGGLVLGYGQERGRSYGPYRGDLCRGISSDLCDWRLSNELLEARR